MKSIISVPASGTGLRLDVFLSRNFADRSRSTLQKLVESGMVLVNGQSVKSGHKLRKDDIVEVEFPEVTVSEGTLTSWEFPLTILYEDEWILAVDKPPHLVVHPGAGRADHTLVNALIGRYPEIRSVGHPLRPGIVHRIDKETSGVLLIARTEASYLRLTAMFKDRKIEKHYRALAYGVMSKKQGRIDTALGRDPIDRKKISVRARKSREAVTLYNVLKQYSFAALLDVQILTGRTHQIRVHLSSEGHPILGDAKYGGGNWTRIPDPVLRIKWKQSAFFGLHAFSLRFSHPFTQEPIYIESPLPASWNF